MRFLCHTAHTPYLTIVIDFLPLQTRYSHPEVLLSHLIKREFSLHRNIAPFMPFSLFSDRYATQLRQRSFRTPLPTGTQGTRTHRQDPRMGPQPARARKRMRNGKRKTDRMARCKRWEKKPEKMPGGKDNGGLCSPACFSGKIGEGDKRLHVGQYAAPSSAEKTGGRGCYSSRCGRLRTEKMGNHVMHSERVRWRGNTPTGGAPTGSRPYP